MFRRYDIANEDDLRHARELLEQYRKAEAAKKNTDIRTISGRLEPSKPLKIQGTRELLDQVFNRGSSRTAFSRSMSRRFLAVKTPHSFSPFT